MVFSIPATESRGISIQQLEALGEDIERYFSSNEYVDSRTHEEVTIETINLYHINDLFIKPKTESDQSYIEYVANNEQPPKWFVSHAWSTSYFDTLRMLRLHAKERKVDHETEYYWICAFAINQHNIDDLALQDFKQLPFAKAMMHPKCEGTVVVLDEFKATPFTRSWCVFEAYLSVLLNSTNDDKESSHTMDFTTIIPDGVCQQSGREWNERCAGLLFDDEETSDHPGDPTKAWFPPTVSTMGVNVDIDKAEATQPLDKENISNWIGDKKDEVNLTIKRAFLPPAIYMAATDDVDPDRLQELMECGIVSKEEAVEFADEAGCLVDLTEYDDDEEYLECFKYLLESGCDPNYKILTSGKYRRPLDFVFELGNYAYFDLLIKYGADPCLISKTKIEKSFHDGEMPEEAAELLLERGIEL